MPSFQNKKVIKEIWFKSCSKFAMICNLRRSQESIALSITVHGKFTAAVKPYFFYNYCYFETMNPNIFKKLLLNKFSFNPYQNF